MYQVTKNKILAEVLEEKENETGLVTTATRKPHIEVKVLGKGCEVVDVKVGDHLIVFNVYDAQVMEYEGKRLVFIKDEDSHYFKK